MPAVSAAAELRGAVAALAFLTRLPLARRFDAGAGDVARGAWAFPLAGAGIGAAVGVVAIASEDLLTPMAGAAMAVLAGVLLTGALHLDGLADSADGLGGPTRETALRAMRDHAVGVYGATAIALDLLLRTALLAALLEHGPSVVLAASLAAGAISRAAVLCLPLALPYAQPAAGAGAALSGRGGVARAAIALAIAAAASLAVAGIDAFICLGVALAAAVLVGGCARRRLGGITGDVLGAVVEVVEIACLMALVVAP